MCCTCYSGQIFLDYNRSRMQKSEQNVFTKVALGIEGTLPSSASEANVLFADFFVTCCAQEHRILAVLLCFLRCSYMMALHKQFWNRLLLSLKESLHKLVLVKIFWTSAVCGLAFWSIFLQSYEGREPEVFCFEKCTNMIALQDWNNCNVGKNLVIPALKVLIFCCPKEQDYKESLLLFVDHVVFLYLILSFRAFTDLVRARRIFLLSLMCNVSFRVLVVCNYGGLDLLIIWSVCPCFPSCEYQLICY